METYALQRQTTTTLLVIAAPISLTYVVIPKAFVVLTHHNPLQVNFFLYTYGQFELTVKLRSGKAKEQT